MPTDTLHGAAIPKAPQEIKNRGGQRKAECFDCGECTAYVSRAAIRDGKLPHCHCGAGSLVPSVLEDCADLSPDLLPRHPLYQLDLEREHRKARNVGQTSGWSAGKNDPRQCGSCSWLRPAGADPDHWLCPKCGDVNDHGTSSSTTPFGVEAERARGLVRHTGQSAPVIPLDRLRPSTRAERQEEARSAAVSASIPF